jgi:hypothetical protein
MPFVAEAEMANCSKERHMEASGVFMIEILPFFYLAFKRTTRTVSCGVRLTAPNIVTMLSPRDKQGVNK